MRLKFKVNIFCFVFIGIVWAIILRGNAYKSRGSCDDIFDIWNEASGHNKRD